MKGALDSGQPVIRRSLGKGMRMAKIGRMFMHYLGNGVRGMRLLFLRSLGVSIGRNTMISLGAKIDVRRGKVSIGDNCLVTHGVKILSHDGAMRLIDPTDNGSGFVNIGNNVFVGVNSVILRNVTVGDNFVIAAGAIVSRDVPSGSVVAGNPARVVKQLKPPFEILNNPHH